MAKSKKRKGHKAKVAKRNTKIADQKRVYDKAMKNYMAEIQKQMQERAEKEADNTKTGTITSLADGILDAANVTILPEAVEVVEETLEETLDSVKPTKEV